MSFLSLLSLSAALATTPGEVTTPFPTINHLAVEWQIEGDDDLDAICEVTVRKEGETAWRDAEALRRVSAGKSSWTFTKLPGTHFESHGRIFEVKTTIPDDPPRAYEPPDLSQLTEAGAYAGEKVPMYGPRP